MAKKLPSDAFDYYLSLGGRRSYRRVAEHHGVSKTTVVNRAKKEGWQDRIETLEAKAREGMEQKTVETIEAMKTRHLKSFRVMQGKALEALGSMSLSSAMEAVRALDLSIKGECLVRGEPSERTVLSVEETIRQEYERWMTVEEESEEKEEE